MYGSMCYYLNKLDAVTNIQIRIEGGVPKKSFIKKWALWVMYFFNCKVPSEFWELTTKSAFLSKIGLKGQKKVRICP